MINRCVSSPANRRLGSRALFVLLPLIVANLFVVWSVHHGFHPEGVLALMSAVVYASPLLAGIVVFALYLWEEEDEFQKVMISRALLLGIGATLAVITLWGAMEKFKLVPVMHVGLVVGLFSVFFVIALKVLRWRYR